MFSVATLHFKVASYVLLFTVRLHWDSDSRLSQLAGILRTHMYIHTPRWTYRERANFLNAILTFFQQKLTILLIGFGTNMCYTWGYASFCYKKRYI